VVAVVPDIVLIVTVSCAFEANGDVLEGTVRLRRCGGLGEGDAAGTAGVTAM
jgi:hypothetical protein